MTTVATSPDAVNLWLGTPGDPQTTLISVTMKTRKWYTDGTEMKPGLTYLVTQDWANNALSRGWIIDVNKVIPQPMTPVYTSGFNTDPVTGDAGSFAPAGFEATVLATATPIWFPSGGQTKVFVAPLTAAQGVRIALGTAAAVSQSSDTAVQTADNAAKVIVIEEGFWVRRDGAADCSVNLRLGN